MFFRILSNTLLTAIAVVVVVGVAGFIKFNILQDDIYVELEDGTVVPFDEYDTTS